VTENARIYATSIRFALRAAVQQVEDNYANIHIPTPGQRGAVIGIINKITGGDDNRKLLLGWLFAGEGELFDKVSTKTLLDEQWAALYAWCDFRKDEDRVIWIPKETFAQECLACLSAAMDDYFKVRYSERDGLPSPPDIIADMVELGGEITQTINAGIGGAPDEMFEHEKDLPIPNTPNSPYIHIYSGEKITVDPDIPVIKPVFQVKPKLINPFE
jgi:hypothetical protein